MTVSGWEPEPRFGDALAGSGGMADPVEPAVFASALTPEVFPDVLSAAPLVPPSAPVLPAAPLPVLPAPAARAQPQPRRTNAYPPPAPSRLAFPPPGGPPVSARPPMALTPPIGYRPTAGTGYVAAATTAPAVRPPAYLPQNPGLAQVRTAVRQAREQTRNAARRRPGAATKKSGAAGAWGCLVVLGLVLFSSGVAQRIIDAVSDLLQRK